jgi:hypothetical protein
MSIGLPEGKWTAFHTDAEGNVLPGGAPEEKGNVWTFRLAELGTLKFNR